MIRRLAVGAVLALVVAACGEVGLGQQTCEQNVRVPTGANILAAQAVPTARYTPCVNTIDPGWDGIEFEAESGRAGIAVLDGTDRFLTAIVTETCDPGEARPVPSGEPDIVKYEDVVVVPSEILVTVIPESPAQLRSGVALLEMWDGVEVDERRVMFSLDSETMTPISDRVSRALRAREFVWLLDELDAVEGTIEMRTPLGLAFPKITPGEALDEIEDLAPEPTYRGNWYFTFDGGCITYLFDAEGLLAETVASVATQNLGFYPAYQLRDEVAADPGGGD